MLVQLRVPPGGRSRQTLGEEAAAAIVLRRNRSATDKQIREFASHRLAQFKVPRQLVFVDEIPKGPTGKLQRVGLAEKLGLPRDSRVSRRREADYVAPRTPIETKLAAIWAQIFHVDQVGVHDDFFETGGHSLLAARMVSRIRDKFRIDSVLANSIRKTQYCRVGPSTWTLLPRLVRRAVLNRRCQACQLHPWRVFHELATNLYLLLNSASGFSINCHRAIPLTIFSKLRASEANSIYPCWNGASRKSYGGTNLCGRLLPPQVDKHSRLFLRQKVMRWRS